MRQTTLSMCPFRRTGLAAVLCLILPACQPAVPIAGVGGTITYNGDPLPGGSVLLLSEATGFGASADIQRDGTFFFVSQHGKGLPLGDYRVSVWVPRPGEVDGSAPGMGELLKAVGIKLPRKFQDPATSGLKTTVDEGTNTIDLKLEGKE